MLYKLSPSDFSFLYEGCKRCFYLKVVYGISQPSIPLPSVFSQIAGLLKNHYSGKHTRELHPLLPSGIVHYGEKYVKSKIITLPNRKSQCYISGRFDIVVRFDDKTYGVIDFKTGNLKEESCNLYARQLHAYAYALENPVPGALHLSPTTKMGLLFFYPTRTNQPSVDKLHYESDIQWFEVKRNDDMFLKFIDEVLSLLESPTPPLPSPKCNWCNYLARLKKTTFDLIV